MDYIMASMALLNSVSELNDLAVSIYSSFSWLLPSLIIGATVRRTDPFSLFDEIFLALCRIPSQAFVDRSPIPAYCLSTLPCSVLLERLFIVVKKASRTGFSDDKCAREDRSTLPVSAFEFIDRVVS